MDELCSQRILTAAEEKSIRPDDQKPRRNYTWDVGNTYRIWDEEKLKRVLCRLVALYKGSTHAFLGSNNWIIDQLAALVTLLSVFNISFRQSVMRYSFYGLRQQLANRRQFWGVVSFEQ